MFSYSVTAPVVHPEQEEHEYSELNTDEKQAIVHDVFGYHADDIARQNEREITQQEFDAFHEALEDIPIDERAGYELATIHCPDLLETETNPRLFLVREAFQPDKAARRLVAYWNMRVDIFGMEKAFLPMTFAGALHGEDEVYRLMELFPNFRTFLPDDQHGRTVVYCETYYGNNDFISCSRTNMMKYVWYNLHLALKRESTILRGVVFILKISPEQLPLHSFDRLKNKMILKATKDCFPVFIRAAHYCTRPNGLHQRMLLPMLKFFMNRDMRQRLIIHIVDHEKVYLEMDRYSVSANGLPTCMGGLFTPNPHWAFEQREIEEAAQQQP